MESAGRIADLRETGGFVYRWPAGSERFDRGWEFTFLGEGGTSVRVRHALSRKECFGRERVHSVTWVNGQPTAEAAEAEDYARTRALVGIIKDEGGRDVVEPGALADGYRGFEIVRHRDEVVGPFARRGLAVKVRDDDLGQWARFALLRREARRSRAIRHRA